MNEHKAVPNIRFNGFKDEFKVGKLENFFDIKDGTHSSPQYINSGFPLVTSKNLTESGLKLENASYISKSDFDEINKRSKVDVGDILFGMIGTIGTPVMVKENNFAIKNVALIKEYSKPKVLNIWLIYYFQSPAFDKFIHFRSAGGTQKFLALGVIQNMKFKFPLKKEQQKIGNFFTKLDKLLDLQQQKIDKLELLKKALLQKLFPKHDAKIPELRFKGYDGEWEKEKLSKFGHTFSGLSGKTKKDFGHGKAKYITYMNVFKNPLTSKTELDDIEVDSKQHTVKYGDVLFTMSSETPDEVGMSSVWKYHLENIYLNSFSFGYRHSTKFDLNFLAFMFRSQVVREQIKILAQGISRYNISKNKMMDILAYFPTESEQQKIGNLLSKVDQLIELENKKLQNLQQVKKCLLQNMFVE